MNEETWIVGINPVESALASDADGITELRFDKTSHNPRLKALLQEAERLGILMHHAGRRELDQISGKNAKHQGVAIRYRMPAPGNENDLEQLLQTAAVPQLFLILDGVTDPHNLGACIRSAAAASVNAVIIPKDRAAGLTPTVQRAAAGGVQKVTMIEVTNLRRSLELLKEAGVWLVGLAGEGETSLYQCDLKGNIGIVMGSEGDGLRRLTRDTCDYLAHIPMPGAMESLNVSVATGISLFEVLRQRGSHG